MYDLQKHLAKLRYGEPEAYNYLPCGTRGYPCHMVNCPPEFPTKIDYGNGCCSCSYVKGATYMNVKPLYDKQKAGEAVKIEDVYNLIRSQTGGTYPPTSTSPPPTSPPTSWPSTSPPTSWQPYLPSSPGQYQTWWQMPPFGPPPIYVMPPVWSAYGTQPQAPPTTPPPSTSVPGDAWGRFPGDALGLIRPVMPLLHHLNRGNYGL